MLTIDHHLQKLSSLFSISMKSIVLWPRFRIWINLFCNARFGFHFFLLPGNSGALCLSLASSYQMDRGRTNEWVVSKLRQRPCLLQDIDRQKLSFVGHVIRNKGLGCNLITGIVFRKLKTWKTQNETCRQY